MTTLPPLHQQIILDASGVPAAVAKTKAGMAEVSVAAEAAAVKTGTLGKTLKMFAGSLFFTGGLIMLANSLRQMRDEAIQTEVAQQELNLALNNSGMEVSKLSPQLNEYASSFQKLGFEGSDATKALARLITVTGDVEQSHKLMGLAADYARKNHTDLASAARILARATTGNMRAFTQYGIVIDKTLPKNKAIEKAFDDLNKKIGGSAQAYLKTFAGKMEVLAQTFQDFIENAIGPVLPYITKFLGALIGVAQWIQKNSGALKVYIGLLAIVITYLKGVAAWNAIVAATQPWMYMVAGMVAVGVVFVKLWNMSTIFRETMAETLATIIGLIGYLVGGVATLIGLLALLPGGEKLRDTAKAANEMAINIGKAAKAVDDLKNKKLTGPKMPKMPDFVKPGDTTGIKGNAIDTKGQGTGGAGNVQFVTVYASDTNDIAKKLSQAAKNGLPIGGR